MTRRITEDTEIPAPKDLEHRVSVLERQAQLLANTPGIGEATGSVTASLGSNSPAITGTAPYTWRQIRTANGSTAWVPAWR